MSVSFNKKPRKEGLGMFTTDGHDVWIGRDWALTNEINDTKAKTKSRSCYRECRTCGACANSRRDYYTPQEIKNENGIIEIKAASKSYDDNAGKWIDCKRCEPFRFHDCHNGWFRDAHGDAEPFTEDALALLNKDKRNRPLF